MHDDCVIRSFEPRDQDAVAALWRAVFPGDPAWNDPAAVIRRKLTVQPDLLLVGERAGVVIATVIGGFDGHRGWIYHLAVAAAERRRGIGRAMMAAVEERLRALGCTKINLQIRRSNAEVVGFYERLGYAVEDRISMGKRVV